MSDASGWTAPGQPGRPGGYGPPGPAGPGPVDPAGPGPAGPGPTGGWGEPPRAPGAVPPPPRAPRPGIVPLRPLRMTELWDGAFQAIRSNPGPVLGWSAVVVVVVTALSTLSSALFLDRFTALTDQLADPSAQLTEDQALDQVAGAMTGGLGAFAVGGLATLVATGLLAGVVTVSVSTAVLGRRTSAAGLWERVRPRLGPLLLLSVLVPVAVSLAVLVCLAPGGVALAAGSVLAGVLLLLVGALGGVAVALWLTTRLLLATPALVLEGQGVGGAVRRSWHLTGAGTWRLLGIWLLTSVLVAVAGTVVTAPFQLIGGLLGALASSDGTPSLVVPLAVTAVGTALVNTVLYPLSAAVTALLYVDARMRREGLDVELARAAASPAA